MALPRTRSDRSDKQGRGDSIPQRRVPSFKLFENDYASSKRLRNRMPSLNRLPSFLHSVDSWGSGLEAGAGGDRAGPRLMSFNLAGLWDPSLNLGFAPEESEEDGEGEDIVQRLDDTMLDNLALFDTSDGHGSSVNSGDAVGTFLSRGSCDGDMQCQSSWNRNTNDAALSSNRPASKDQAIRHICTLAATDCDVVDQGTFGAFSDPTFTSTRNASMFPRPMEVMVNQQLAAAEKTIRNRAHDDSRSSIASAPTHGASMLSLALDAAPGSNALEKNKRGTEGLYNKNGEHNASFLNISPPSDDEDSEEYEFRTGAQLDSMFTDQRPELTDNTTHCSDSSSDSPLPTKVGNKDINTGRKGHVPKKRQGGRGPARGATSRKVRNEVGEPNERAASCASSTGGGGGSNKRQTSEDVAARLPLDVLECFYHVPLNVAAQELHVSLTMLKKLCRAYGVKRWPHRQVSSLDKTIARLEDKIAARSDGGRDAPSLLRKLQQAIKRRSVIIKTASAGLEADVLNTIFTCRPGDIDEDLLLESTDVARTVGKIQSGIDGHDSDSESESGERGSYESERNDNEESCVAKNSLRRSGQRKSRITVAKMPPRPSRSSSIRFSAVKQSDDVGPPPAFDSGCPTKTFVRSTRMAPSTSTRSSRKVRKGLNVSSKTRKGAVTKTLREDGGGEVSRAAAAAAVAAMAAAAAASPPELCCETHAPDCAEGAIDIALSKTNPLSFAQTSFTFGAPAGSFAHIPSYSNVFGTGVRPQPATGTRPSIHSAVDACGTERCTRDATSGQIGDETATKAIAAQVAAPAETTEDDKPVPSCGSWFATQAPLVRSPVCRPPSRTGVSHPLTSTVAMDGFDTKLRLESPTPAQSIPSGQVSLRRPQSRHTYLQQQFPTRHHNQTRQPDSYHVNWQGHRHIAAASQYPFVFSVEGISPIDTKNYVPIGQARGDIIEAFPKSPQPMLHTGREALHSGTKPLMQDAGSDGKSAGIIGNPTAKSARRAPSSQIGPSTAADTAAASDGAPRRTGFMSYLLHQSTNSVPHSEAMNVPEA